MPECKFGDNCYRKNVEHLKEFHPSKIEEKKNEIPETTVKRTQKRKIEDEFVDKEGKQKKDAKMKKEKEAKEEEEKDGEKEEMVELIYDECGTVEEVVQTEYSPSKTGLPQPHRAPFCEQPLSVYTLWKKALTHEPKNPRDAFCEINGLRLVGFFDFLAGDLKEATDDEIRLHARYATDVPEMQTIMVTHSGRYALWRDDPKQTTSMVVHVKNGDDHFTKITMVGDKCIHALVHAAGEGAESMLHKFYPSSVHKWATVAKVKQDAKTAIAKRHKMAIGRPLHGMRLWVHVDCNDVGYRSIGEDLNKMKRTMTMVGEATDDVVRKKKMAELREIATYIQLAIDECDFGTGLEFGHDLFIANFPNLDPMAKRYLAMAYQLLGRDEFGAILNAQMESGVRRRENVMITK